MIKSMEGYRWLTLYVDLYGDGLISCHMTNDDNIIPLIIVSQLVEGQRLHVHREHISTISGRCEGHVQVSLAVPCDLRFRDIWVVVFNCNSNGEFSVDQSDHFGADGSNDRHSWREREREREREGEGEREREKTQKLLHVQHSVWLAMDSFPFQLNTNFKL